MPAILGTKKKNVFRNIFSGSPTEEAIFANPFNAKLDTSKEEPESPMKSASKKLMDLYNEESPSQKAYDDYLRTQPNEEDYKPSQKRRLGAALVGFLGGLSDPELGLELGSRITHGKFDSAIKNWERKRLPLANAAEVEGKNRNSKITALKDFINAEHQSQMDDSLINSRESEAAHRRELENQAREAAKKLEEERLRQDADRDEGRRQTDKNRTDDNNRADKVFEETKRHNAQTEAIARRNADSTAIRAGAYRSSVEGLNAYRDHLKTKVSTQGNTPSGQKTAEELAIHDTFLKPGNSQRYGDFFDQNPSNGRITLTPPVKGTFQSEESYNEALTEYTLLQAEIKKRKDEILVPLKTSPNAKPKDEKPKRNIQIVKNSRG